MEFEVIFYTARKIVIEIKNGGVFYTQEKYCIWINGAPYMTSNRIIETIDDLTPDTIYQIRIIQGCAESNVIEVTTKYEYVTLNVKRFGAIGDGKHDDTLAIQAAVSCCPKDSRVLIPKGCYKVSSIFLKSNITLEIGEGAVLSAYAKRDKYAILPGLTESYDEQYEYNLGTWEGNPLRMFSAIITGIDVSDVVITGKGTIDGNGSYDNWWKEFRTIVGAYRPRMIFLNGCRDIVLHQFTTRNSPSWNIHPYFSDHLRILHLNIYNPKVSPNTDGIDPESCRNVEIAGTYFSVGDDCIAIKSGKLYMGRKYKRTCEHIDIRQCYMRDGHGSVTLGSEMAAGIKHLHVKDCLFHDTDRGLRIKTRRGRGKDAVIEDVLFENIYMDNVLSPFTVNSFYWDCDPDGHTEYVSSKQALPVDERTPEIKQLAFRHIEAKNCHVCGMFIYGLPEKKIEELTMEDIHITYSGDPVAEYPVMMAGVDKTTKMGIFVRNVERLILKNVDIEGQNGAAYDIDGVGECIFNGRAYIKEGEVNECRKQQ